MTKCAWSPTPVTQKWCVPFVVACDPIRARSIIFEGSLAEKLRFWVSQLHFWRTSRRKASFLKEVSQKSLVFEFRSFVFEGSLAEKFGFWVSKLHFWRKSRRKASFKGFEATWFLFIYLSIYLPTDRSIYLILSYLISSYLILSYLSIYLSYLSLSLSIYLSLCFYLVISLSLYLIWAASWGGKFKWRSKMETMV